MKKKVLRFLLCVCIILSITPVSVFADGADGTDPNAEKTDISKAVVALKENVSYTYNGTEQQPTANDITITLDGTTLPVNTTNFIINCGNNVNAGDAEITVTAADDNPTHKGTATGTFRIEKCRLTITAKQQTVYEVGAIQTSNVSYVTIGDDSTSLAVGDKLTDITLTADLTTNTIYASNAVIKKEEDTGIAVTANYDITYLPGTLTVLKPAISFTIKNPIVYDGGPVTAGTDETCDIVYNLIDCEGNPSIKWYDASGATQLEGAPTDAGLYLIKISVSPDGTAGASVNEEQRFMILKAELTAKVQQPKTITYGQNPQDTDVLSNSVEYSGFIGRDSASIISGEPIYSTDYTQYGDVDGTYTITADMSNVTAQNYTFKVVPSSLTVTPLPVNLSWFGHTDRTFGDGKAVTATVSNLMNHDAVQVTVEGGAETSVGNHTATATGLTGEKAKNYILTEAVTQDYTIGKADAPTNVVAQRTISWDRAATQRFELSDFTLPHSIQNAKITSVTKDHVTQDNQNIFAGNPTYTDGTVTIPMTKPSEFQEGNTGVFKVTITSDSHEMITAMIHIKIVEMLLPPKTGDGFMAEVWLMAAAISAVAIAVLGFSLQKQRRRNTDES